MKILNFKILTFIAASLCLTAVFTSCSKNNADDYIDGWIDDLTGATSKNYNSTGQISGNFASLLDIQVEYTYNDKKVSKAINQDGSWNVTIESIGTNQAVEGKFIVVCNSTPIDENTDYSLSYTVKNSFTYYSEAGKELKTVEGKETTKSLSGIKTDKINEAIESLNKTSF